MKHFCKLLFIVGIAACIVACTTIEEVTVNHYLKLNSSTITFRHDETSTQEIIVKANPASFNAEANASWVKIADQTPSAIIVAVDPNEGEERSATITVTCADMERIIKVNQLGTSSMNARCRIESTWKNGVLSPNGKYFGGVFVDVGPDDAFVYTAIIRNLETEEQVEFGPYPSSLFTLDNAGGISDTGVMVVKTNSGSFGTVIFDLSESNYFAPKDIPNCKGRPVLYKTSADGSVWVGYVSGGPAKVAYTPVKYIDGEAKLLPLPEHNFRYEELWAGIIARGVSADGSIVYGSTWENYDYGMVYWDKDDNFHWVGEDVRELVQTVTLYNGLGEPFEYHLTNGMTNTSYKYQISPGGKWIAGTYRTEKLADDGETIIQSSCPAFYNTETQTTTLFEEFSGCLTTGATDDGLGFILDGTSYANSGRVVDIERGVVISDMTTWIKDNYGVISPGGYIEYVSADKKVILGRQMLSAAQGVAYINYYIAPPLE